MPIEKKKIFMLELDSSYPKETGGAILSLDKMIDDAWLWAGQIGGKILVHLWSLPHRHVLQSDDPDNLCSKWEKHWNKTKSSGAVNLIVLKYLLKKY